MYTDTLNVRLDTVVTTRSRVRTFIIVASMKYLHLSAQFVIILERQSTILPSVYIGKIMQAVFTQSSEIEM